MNARVLYLKSPSASYDIQPGRKDLRHLSDSKLLDETKCLAKKEREILADILLHLSEIGRRKLFSPKYQSLLDYSVHELGYSEDQAVRRLSAMRLLNELPEIEKDIIDGSLNLTTLNLARTHFRNEEKAAEISLSKNSKAHTTSKAASNSTSNAAPNIAPGAAREEKLKVLSELKDKSSREAVRVLIEKSSAPEKIKHFESVKPVSATLSEVKILADDETLNKIAKLKGLLAYKHPHITNGELVAIALDIAINALDPSHGSKRKNDAAVPAAPRVKPSAKVPALPSRTSSYTIKPNHSRYVPAHISRDVWRRSDGKCAMCGSAHALEKDHITPFALGGETSKENLRLLCRNCNQRRAIMTFGRRN